MDYISREALYEKTAEWEAQALHMVEVTMNDEDPTEWRKWSTILTERSAFKFDVADFPAADVEEVIRCKDCKYFNLNKWGKVNDIPLIVAHEICDFWGEGCKTDKDGYCSFAERREE